MGDVQVHQVMASCQKHAKAVDEQLGQKDWPYLWNTVWYNKLKRSLSSPDLTSSQFHKVAVSWGVVSTLETIQPTCCSTYFARDSLNSPQWNPTILSNSDRRMQLSAKEFHLAESDVSLPNIYTNYVEAQTKARSDELLSPNCG